MDATAIHSTVKNTPLGKQEPSENGIGIAIAKFAHEFANELNVVTSAVQLLENDLNQPTQTVDTIRYIKNGVKRLGYLLKELQSLAKAQKLSLRPLQIASVIEELLAIEAPRYAANGVRVEVNLMPDLPLVRLDAAKFRQVLLNLCRNALDAMPHGGRLTLHGYHVDSNVHLDVIDTGEGILPGMDVFALFATTKPTGMGVGLSVARDIVLRHGGTISYSSRPGSGTSFRLILPTVNR
jgi:signal transduction histidine kinase